jgi:V-type H+-transporting ATPase subunit d
MDWLFSGPRHGNIISFNIEDGYLEALVRGFRSKILDANDYANLCQCDSLEDIKLHLSQTDYGDFLQNEPSPLHTTTIKDKCVEKMVNEFNYLRYNAVQPLSTFLDYITYGYMIDNIILLITGALHERDTQELLERCHPLGMFKSIASLTACHNISELYREVLIDTPLGPYIQDGLNEEDFHDEEKNVEIIRNTLYKSYLEDFHKYCQHLGGETANIMGDILQFEADRRAITITINSFGTELTKDDRSKLYPQIGLLHPEGNAKLSKADDIDQVRDAVGYVSEYRRIFQDAGGVSEKSLEDAFFEQEVRLNRLAFETQMGYGAFYAYFKLKEQEIRNIVWLAECISQSQKSKIHQGIIHIF